MTFDPKAHITKLPIFNRQREKVGERDYLPVSARLLWLNAEHESFEIQTEAIVHTSEEATVRAVLTVLDGGGSVIKRVTAHRSCTRARWGDYVEKAETGAIGRALGMLGYGTDGAEFDEGAGEPAAGATATAKKRPAAKEPAKGWRSRDEAEERAEAQQRAEREARQAAAASAEVPDTTAESANAGSAPRESLSARLALVDLPQDEGPDPTPAQFIEWLKARDISLEFAKGVLGIRSSWPLEAEHVQAFAAGNPKRPLRGELRAITMRWNTRIQQSKIGA